MNRRHFLQGGMGLPLAAPRTGAAAPLSREEHRRRLRNIRQCEQSITECLRRHTITSYIPGQAAYNLGEYPSRTPWSPDEGDESELDRLRDHGIGLIQVMEEWNDLLRLFGGDKFRAVNPAGLRKFIEMAHRRRMKVLLYVSTGFMQATDPDFRPEWARPGYLQLVHWNMARCSPASPGWRAHVLPRIFRILDEYDVDGLYDDFGYRPLSGAQSQPTSDEVMAFEETSRHDGALEDLLFLLHAEVKRRGGILKLHQDGAMQPHMAKLYDYLWVGEGIANADALRGAVKNHDPYVVPCFDMSRLRMDDPNEAFLHSIPYLQFPLLLAGKPFTGERALIPGVRYYPSDWTDRWRAMWRFNRAHPKGPFSYGIWDYFPGRPEVRAVHARWLGSYQAMTKEGTRAYLDITRSTLFQGPLASDVVVSAFASDQLHLVAANYGTRPARVELRGQYARVDGEAGPARERWEIPARSLLLLRRESEQ